MKKSMKNLWQNYIFPSVMLVWCTVGAVLFFGWLAVTLYQSFVVDVARIILE